MIWYKRRKDKTKWHYWFAWFPVTVEVTPDGDKKKVWLQWILRCGYYELITNIEFGMILWNRVLRFVYKFPKYKEK